MGVNLAKLSMLAGYLVLLAGDVSSNPGPSIQLESKASKCAFCSKILRKKQPRMACMSAHRNSECKQLKTLFKCLNFKQLINSPTRISRDSKSLIDLIAVN